MCGIAGFSLSPDEAQINVRLLARELSLGIMSRGRDATGVAFYDGKKIKIRKAAVSAVRFDQWTAPAWNSSTANTNVGTGAGWAALEGMADIHNEVQVAIIHTRFATQGDPINPGNNHPIRRGPVVGVHNGWVINDAELFRELKVRRHAEVDSEAIFAMLEHGGRPAYKALDNVNGNMAIAWLDARDIVPTLHLARGTSSPLNVVQTKAGSLIFASTMLDAKRGARAVNLDVDWEYTFEEDELMRVVDGRICDHFEFASRTARRRRIEKAKREEAEKVAAELAALREAETAAEAALVSGE